MPYRKADDVAVEEVEGETIALHLGTSLYYRLNRTGTWAWQVLVRGGDEAQATAAVTARFKVDADTARRDIDALVADLVDAGLLERA